MMFYAKNVLDTDSLFDKYIDITLLEFKKTKMNFLQMDM